MTKMVKWVARALFRWAEEEWAEDWSEELWSDLDDTEKNIWCRKARAAIKAMREPTSEMWKAAKVYRQLGSSVLYRERRDQDPRKEWEAMIDAALK